jgi:serine/threonine-protein kinase
MSYPEEKTSPVDAPSKTAHLEVDGELPPGMAIGEYRIEARIGDGAMGVVYSAIQPVIGKRAAVKVMNSRLCVDPVAVERFVQEARAVNQIGHPNIVDVFAFGSLPDGRSYLIMEWLQGETLGQRLQRGPVPLSEAVAILFQISDGLAAAHDKNVVHRDLKPENIFLMPVRKRRLMVKLLDFGVAKLRGAGGVGRVDHTAEGHSVGTPRYMSPEQARGKETDHRADIYSLGVTAYEMLVGRVPFEGDEAIDLMHKHVYEVPPSPNSIRPELPVQLDRLLMQMLEKRADRRPTLPQVETVLGEIRDFVIAPDEMASAPGALRGLETGKERVIRGVDDNSDSISLRPTRSRRPMLLVGAAVLPVIVIAVVVSSLRKPAPTVVAAPAPVESAPAPVAAPSAAPAPAAAPAPPTLVVHLNVPDARIELDGKRLADAVHEGRFPVATAGDHELVVSAPHHKPLRRSVALADNAVVELDLQLERVVAAPPPAPKRKAPRARGDRDYMVDPFAAKK